MRNPKRWRYLALLGLFGILTFVLAQDQFDWLPPGGATLLVSVAQECESCGDLTELLTTERTKEEWIDHFDEMGAGEIFEEHEIATVAGYLSIVAPMAAGEVPQGSPLEPNQLPDDGRILTLQQCMICHGIVRPVTQTWAPEKWMSHLSGGTHGTIGIPDIQKRLIANFLGHNTVDVEQIPEGQRGTTPGY